MKKQLLTSGKRCNKGPAYSPRIALCWLMESTRTRRDLSCKFLACPHPSRALSHCEFNTFGFIHLLSHTFKLDRAAYGNDVDFFGGPQNINDTETLIGIEQQMNEAFFVILSDVWLDQPKVKILLLLPI